MKQVCQLRALNAAVVGQANLSVRSRIVLATSIRKAGLSGDWHSSWSGLSLRQDRPDSTTEVKRLGRPSCFARVSGLPAGPSKGRRQKAIRLRTDRFAWPTGAELAHLFHNKPSRPTGRSIA